MTDQSGYHINKSASGRADRSEDFHWHDVEMDFELFPGQSPVSGPRAVLDSKSTSLHETMKGDQPHARLRHSWSESSLRSHHTGDNHRESGEPAVPGLTPDASPEMQDNLDDEHDLEFYQPTPRFLAPTEKTQADAENQRHYKTVIVEPPPRLFSALEYGKQGHDGDGDDDEIDNYLDEEIDDDDDDDDDPPLEFYIQQHLQPRRPLHLQRPGLIRPRTLSGKLHSWRRPSWQIYPVREASDEGEA